MKLAYLSVAAGLALALAVVAVSCNPDPSDGAAERGVTQLALPENVLSEELMLPLRQAQNLHHIADVYLLDGNLTQATEAVRQILELRFPEGAAEGEDVVLDARARLGTLLVTAGELDQAMTILDAGIAGATRESFFLSNVYTVKGKVHEARAVALKDSDEVASKEQARLAIVAYSRSIEIDEVLKATLYKGAGK
ncbi:MAG TPA: hypothetical protein VML75_19030 [Kofleriaceae bacterium]|nr:hypothetical protein [Kofleriaceae bacterium]